MKMLCHENSLRDIAIDYHGKSVVVFIILIFPPYFPLQLFGNIGGGSKIESLGLEDDIQGAG